MSFTRKHYVEVARIIHDLRVDANNALWSRGHNDGFQAGARAATNRMQSDLARMFAADNPRFDRERFNVACEPGSDK